MPGYCLAVSNTDAEDCRPFIDKEAAIEYIKKKKDVHYEERSGRLVKYFKGTDLKTTVFDGECLEDAIYGNKDIISCLVRSDIDEPHAEIFFDEVSISVHNDVLYSIYSGHTHEGDHFEKKIMFLDAAKEEIKKNSL